MVSQIQLMNERSVDTLIDAILTRSANVPNFALFLGSGASSTSHVKTASEMINEWRRRLYERSGTKNSFDEWLKKQEWYDTDDEYAALFELSYDQRPLRRAYIEECLRDAHPGWGYAYLTNLLKHNMFNVVFTTNFDDLINEACFLYSDVRPLVCAHDSAVSGIRITSARPKIIKLHGDFLFDSIKNTVRELETLESNMKEKLKQFAREYGLVVAGYSGRDRSVMDVLDMFVRQDEYFKQGIYWCELEGEEKKGKRLSTLLRRDDVYLAKIAGFDEFMAEISHKAEFGLPRQVADPLRVAEEKARLFTTLPGSMSKSKIINADRDEVIKNLSQASSHKIVGAHLPLSFRVAVLRQKRELETALEEVEEAYKEDPDDTSIAWEKASLLDKLGDQKKLKDLIYTRPVGKDPIWDSTKAYYLLRANDNDGAKKIAEKVLESDPTDYIARINLAIALKRLGRRGVMEKELSILEGQVIKEDVRAGIATLRRDKDKMLFFLKKAMDKGLITPDEVGRFVVFEDYWGDNDLANLLAKKRHKGLDKEEEV